MLSTQALGTDLWSVDRLDPNEIKTGIRLEDVRLTAEEGMLSREAIKAHPIMARSTPARNAAFTHRSHYEKAVRLQRLAKEPLRGSTQEAGHHPAGPGVHRLFQINVGANRHSLSESHQPLSEGVCVLGKEIESRLEVNHFRVRVICLVAGYPSSV